MNDFITNVERLAEQVLDEHEQRKADLYERQVACRDRLIEEGVYLRGNLPDQCSISATPGPAGHPIS